MAKSRKRVSVDLGPVRLTSTRSGTKVGLAPSKKNAVRKPKSRAMRTSKPTDEPGAPDSLVGPVLGLDVFSEIELEAPIRAEVVGGYVEFDGGAFLISRRDMRTIRLVLSETADVVWISPTWRKPGAIRFVCLDSAGTRSDEFFSIEEDSTSRVVTREQAEGVLALMSAIEFSRSHGSTRGG